MKIYFVGIGGIGMSGVAGLAKTFGFEVFGSDEKELYPPASLLLQDLGIEVSKPDPERILKLKPDLLVVGNAVKAEHKEVVLAQKNGIPLLSFPEFLEKFILNEKKNLVVAGTHGKTTTSALLAFVLDFLKQDPIFLVGGLLKDYGKNFRSGRGEYCVLEGDEYPSSFFDKNPKFLHYKPFGLILTSLEFDHADAYKDLSELKEAFSNLIKLLPPEGILVYHFDDANLREVVEKAEPTCKVLTYGRKDLADYQLIENTSFFEKNGFTNIGKIRDKRGEIFEIKLKIPGFHNLLNALSVLALCESLGFERNNILYALSKFSGVKRRQEIININENFVIIDDFAHHPTAVEITLFELKNLIKPDKMVLVFEPRTNSSKRKIFQEAYVKALALADVIFIKIPPGLENIPENERIDLNYVLSKLKEKGKEAFIFEKNCPFDKAKFNSERRTLIVFMSSAFMKNEIEELSKLLNQEFYV